MSKKSKSKATSRKTGGLSHKRSGGKIQFKHALRDASGKFTTVERKTAELLAIEDIKRKHPEYTKTDVRKALFAPTEFVTSYKENALEASYNFDSYIMDEPEVTIIDTEGVIHKFRNMEHAKATFNENLSSMWRVATMLQDERTRKQKKNKKKISSDTIIPEFKVVSTETVSGLKTKVTFNFAENNLNQGLQRDMSQWEFDESEEDDEE